MHTFKGLIIDPSVIALFGSGVSLLDLNQADLLTIRSSIFVITMNYAPVRFEGHLNIWSDPKVSFFLEQYYQHRHPKVLLGCRKGMVSQDLKPKINYWFSPKEDGLAGNFTAVWTLQLLQKYFPEKKILLFGFDFYVKNNGLEKWYDLDLDYDKIKRKKSYNAISKLTQCANQIKNI